MYNFVVSKVSFVKTPKHAFFVQFCSQEGPFESSLGPFEASRSERHRIYLFSTNNFYHFIVDIIHKIIVCIIMKLN